MKIIEQVFSNTWTFYLVLGCVYIGMFFVANTLIDEFAEDQEVKAQIQNALKKESGHITKIQKELSRRSRIIAANKNIFDEFETRLGRKTRDLRILERRFHRKIDEQTKSRWHYFNMEEFCQRAVRLNPGWKCPDLAEITRHNKMEKK